MIDKFFSAIQTFLYEIVYSEFESNVRSIAMLFGELHVTSLLVTFSFGTIIVKVPSVFLHVANMISAATGMIIFFIFIFFHF